MKHSKFVKFSILGLLPVTMTVGVISSSIHKDIIEANAYNYASLPTTIYLKDNTESEIRDYYSDLTKKSSGELTGNNLLKNLKPILMDGQNYFTYDANNGKQIWQMYEITDRDWKKSPASSITYGSYNKASNVINNYQYGTSGTNSKNNPYIHALYVNRDCENPKTAWDSHTPRSNEMCIEREHIWPKSHGFDDSDTSTTLDGGARGDPMHLWAADGYSNGQHSNFFYGFVDKTKPYEDMGDHFSFTQGNLLGISKTQPSIGTVYEPQDCDKGDIARACFYMVARYNNIAGTDNEINANNPNLCLDMNPTMETGVSTKTHPYSLGLISDLLKWNKLDPVDDYEMHRNNLLFNNYTKNRNPFIDFPDWADYIWGDKKGTDVNPTTDKINGDQSGSETGGGTGEETGGGGGDTPVEENYKVVNSIKVGDKIILGNKAEQVVNSGFKTTSTATFAGTVKINAITDNDLYDVEQGYSSATFSFVKDGEYLSWSSGNSLISSTTKDAHSSWYVSFDGDNATIKNAADNKRIIYYNKSYPRFACYAQSTLGDYLDYVSIYGKEETETVVNVTGVSLNANATEVKVGSAIVLDATVLPSNATNNAVSWSSSDTGVAKVRSGKVTGVSAGSCVITVKTSDGNFTATCNVTVSEPIILESISISGTYKTDYIKNEPFDKTGIKVTAHYSDGSSKDITEEVEFPDDATAGLGSKTVLIEYSGKTASIQINVTTGQVKQIIINTDNVQKTFYKNEAFSCEGLTAQAKYEDGSIVDLELEDLNVTGYSMNSVGTQTVSVSYANKTATYSITIEEFVQFEDESIIFENKGYENASSVPDVSGNHFDIVFDHYGKNPTKYYSSGVSLRVYVQTRVIFTSKQEFKKIKINFGTSDGNNIITSNVGTYEDGVWTGSSKTVILDVGLNASGETSGNRRFKSVEVYFSEEADAPTLDSIELSGDYKTSYKYKEELDTNGLIVTANYSDESTVNVTDSVSFSGYSKTILGPQTITVSYEGLSTTYNVTVSDFLNRLELSGEKKTVYKYNDEFSKENIVVKAITATGVEQNVTALAEFSGYSKTTLGPQTIIVSYEDLSTTYKVTVSDYLKEIKVSGEKKADYLYGETFSKENIVVTATMASGAKKDVSNKAEFSGYDGTKPGLQTVTVKYTDGDIEKTDSYEVYVSDYVERIEVVGDKKTEYTYGEAFSKENIVVNAIMASGAIMDVTDSVMFGGYNAKTLGKQTIKVWYLGNNVDETTTYDVYVSDFIKEITLSGTYKTNYDYNEELDTTGLIVTAKMASGNDVVVNNYSITGFDKTLSGNQTVTVSYDGFTKSYQVVVGQPKLTSISISGQKTEFKYGEAFSKGNAVVTGYYQDNSEKQVEATFEGFDSTRSGNQTITVKCGDISTTYVVHVSDPLLTSISVSGQKTNFKLNENFSKGNAVVTAHYEDGSTKPVTAEFSGYDKNKLGTQTITVTYKEGTATFTTTYNVTVENFGIGISASTNGNIEFARGEDFSAEDVQVKLIMVNGETQIVSNSSVEFTGYNKNKLGEQTITAKYGEFTSTFIVKVIDPVVSISVSGQKTTYNVGEKIDKTGTITITTQTGSTSTVALSKATITGFDTQTAGTKTISVSYGGKTTTYNILVKEAGNTSGLGCFGSLTGTLGLISLVSTLGAGLLLLKKKED